MILGVFAVAPLSFLLLPTPDFKICNANTYCTVNQSLLAIIINQEKCLLLFFTRKRAVSQYRGVTYVRTHIIPFSPCILLPFSCPKLSKVFFTHTPHTHIQQFVSGNDSVRINYVVSVAERAVCMH